jgi:hypothetical protein
VDLPSVDRAHLRFALIFIEDTAVSGIINFIAKLPAECAVSMQRDIINCCKSQLYEKCGAIVRHG